MANPVHTELVTAPDFRKLFESAPGLYLVLTADLTIVAASDAYLRATMTQREDIVGRNLFHVFPDNPDDPEATGTRNLRASLDRVRQNRCADVMALQKYDVRRPDSAGGQFEERYWSPLNSPVFGPDGEIAYIIHRVEDVTEFVELKRAGIEWEMMTVSLRDRAGQIEAEVFLRGQELADTNRRLHKANEQLEGLYNEIAALMAKADKELAVEKGSENCGEVSSKPITPDQMLARIGDLIEGHKRLEQELQQSQKMEAIGRLAGGVAHDFNNLLTVISGYASLVRNGETEGDSTRAVEQIEKAAERAATLTRQLLAFSRRQVLEPQTIDLNTAVVDIQDMLQRLIGEDIELVSALAPDLWQVNADPGQMDQVILNLAVNARDAMPNGGKLTIETTNTELDESNVNERALVKPGEYVLLSMSDTGQGMDSETRSRLFEPFFTTKRFGKGTGLGLSMVYGIVKQSGGYIWVYSEPGKGTAFKIYLPRASQNLTAAEVHPVRAAMPQECGNVLVVEDDDGLRELVTEILELNGYKVLAAANGQEALDFCAGNHQPIHLLLSDLVMPQIDGLKLAERISQSHPDVRILLMSGYTEHAIMRQNVIPPGVHFVHKPFTPDLLAAKVRDVLRNSA